MADKGQNTDFLLAGIHTARILSSLAGVSTSYERAGLYLFQQLSGYIDQLRLYLIDDTGESFQEEAVFTDKRIYQGSDLLPHYQLPKTVVQEGRPIHTVDETTSYFLLPLTHNGSTIGLLDMRSGRELGREVLEEMEPMGEAVAVGLYHSLLARNSMRDKFLFDRMMEIVQQLQRINRIDELLSAFVKLVVRHMRFDRGTVFLFDPEGTKVADHYCVSFLGRECRLESIPELPDLQQEPFPLKHLSGYWFPLRTNMHTIGVALFDNIYSMNKISERSVEVMLLLCSQLAANIENIRLFSDIQNAAQHDKLTGLYNRAFFEEELRRLDNGNQLPVSVIIGDANGLKVTNDVFGHLEGDRILISIAGVLRNSCRSQDVIARWGGDEFILLLPRTTIKQADVICDRIRDGCMKADNTKVQLSISLGHATKERPEEDIMQVLKTAEDRMYRHKLLESKSFRSSFVSSLKETLLEKCQETAGHMERLENLSLIMGRAVGFTDNEMDELKLLAMLHDIGKVAISDQVLNKPGKLDEKEWEEMRQHAEIGYRIAQASSELSQIADYILCHHERWDGSGYPFGRMGLEIPKLSRLISIIDAYDVMTHARSYKDPISHEEAIKELIRCAGSQFDPEMVEIFVGIQRVNNERHTG